MKTHWLLLAVLAIGCGPTSDAVVLDGDELTDDSFELSTTKDTYIIARRDYRKCVAPMCGGYWVKDLNSTMQERYVSAFDFTGSGLAEEVQNAANGAPDFELVLLGRLGPKERRFDTRTLLVKEVYRGMPGQTFLDTDRFYSVFPTKIACITTPCANLQVTRLNRVTGHAMASDLSLTDALGAFVDENWLRERVLTGRAIVAGRVVYGRNNAVTVVSRQVFVALPDRQTSCPRFALPTCGANETVAFERNSNRCTVPVGCTEPRFCALYVPSCDPGYNQVSWQNGCTSYACEPDFLW